MTKAHIIPLPVKTSQAAHEHLETSVCYGVKQPVDFVSSGSIGVYVTCIKPLEILNANTAGLRCEIDISEFTPTRCNNETPAESCFARGSCADVAWHCN